MREGKLCPRSHLFSFVVQLLSRFRLSATLWTVARQTPLSIGFSRQEYWSGLPFPSPGDLPDPRIKPTSAVSPALQIDSLPRATIILLDKRLNFGALQSIKHFVKCLLYKLFGL